MDDGRLSPAQRAAIKTGLRALKKWWFGQGRDPDQFLDELLDALDDLVIATAEADTTG